MNTSNSVITRHKAVSMTVHGRVQGVGFRYFTRTQAQRIGVYGWVRNRADGTVEIWAEGTEDRLHSFIGRVRQGPTHGEVERVDLDWTEPTGKDRTFRIRD
jgi:acylphosphatase